MTTSEWSTKQPVFVVRAPVMVLGTGSATGTGTSAGAVDSMPVPSLAASAASVARFFAWSSQMRTFLAENDPHRPGAADSDTGPRSGTSSGSEHDVSAMGAAPRRGPSPRVVGADGGDWVMFPGDIAEGRDALRRHELCRGVPGSTRSAAGGGVKQVGTVTRCDGGASALCVFSAAAIRLCCCHCHRRCYCRFWQVIYSRCGCGRAGERTLGCSSSGRTSRA
jgi:hypothetical protein